MSKRKDKKPEKLDGVLSNLLEELGMSEDYEQSKALIFWNQAAGETVARVTEPDRIDHGRLYVKVTNSSWRQELMFFKDEIKKQLNELAEEEIVKEIIFF